MIAVTGALVLIALLTMGAFQLVMDHNRRAALTADRALALEQAEAALSVAECDLAMATQTPAAGDCHVAPDTARAAALEPSTLAGFIPGQCADGAALGLCKPLVGQTVVELSDILGDAPHAKPLPRAPTPEHRQPARPARYVIEPIPDAQPGQWLHAGASPSSWLFRVTAAGFGADPAVNVVLQTVYRPKTPAR